MFLRCPGLAAGWHFSTGHQFTASSTRAGRHSSTTVSIIGFISAKFPVLAFGSVLI